MYASNYQCIMLYILVSALEVTPSNLNLSGGGDIVRGYNVSFPFSFAITNKNDTIGIEDVMEANANYNITLVFATRDLSSFTHLTDMEGTLSIHLETSASALQQGIAANGSTVISGSAGVLIPRDTCDSFQYMCALLSPGVGATFKMNPGTAQSVECINIVPVVNCLGNSSLIIV